MSGGVITKALEGFEERVSKNEDLKKAYKDGINLVQVGEGEIDSNVGGYVSTQTPALNVAIGRPGVPQGRLTTLIGLEASGKSTVLLHILAETQRIGGIAVLVDAEHRYWGERAASLGIDNESLVQLQGITLEDNLGLIEQFILAVRAVDPKIPLTIGYDSVAGSPTKADVDGTYGDNIPAKHAKVLGYALRRLHPIVARENVALVLVNQLRDKLAFGFTFGRPQMVMLGEHPLTYWSSLKIHLVQAKRLGEPEAPTGIEVACEILKNTIAPPFRKCRFNINFADGVDYVDSALDVAVDVGLIEDSKGWFVYDGLPKFRRANFAEVLEANPILREQIEAAPLLWTQGI